MFRSPFPAKRKVLARSGRSPAPVPEQSAIRSEERGTRLIDREGDHPPNGSADIRRPILHELGRRFSRGRTGTPGEGPCGGENGGRSFPLWAKKSSEVSDLDNTSQLILGVNVHQANIGTLPETFIPKKACHFKMWIRSSDALYMMYASLTGQL